MGEGSMAISVRHIRKHYRKAAVLRNVSFEAESGSCIGILGKNGCGKSTLLSILSGILRPDEGEFLLHRGQGTGIDLLHDQALRASLVGYVPQSTPLLEELTALDNLRLWYQSGRKGLAEELSTGVLKLLRVDEFLRVPVSRLSGGMKKRLSIGCSVAHHPKILLLDEPGAALDLVCKEIIVEYLKDFCDKGGIAIMASHEIPEIASCTDTLILRDGEIYPYSYAGDVEDLVSHL